MFFWEAVTLYNEKSLQQVLWLKVVVLHLTYVSDFNFLPAQKFININESKFSCYFNNSACYAFNIFYRKLPKHWFHSSNIKLNLNMEKMSAQQIEAA